MHTQLKHDVQPAADDAEVLKAIAQAIRPAARGHTTVVGIRNHCSEVYRVVYANGVAEALALVDNLEKLGLIDDRCESHKALERCDFLFALPAFHPSKHGTTYRRFVVPASPEMDRAVELRRTAAAMAQAANDTLPTAAARQPAWIADAAAK
jgi:hypothetical protein